MAQTVFAPWTDTDQKPLIEFRNVTKSFGDFTAIDNLSLKIYEREFFALLGPSGCGKTTMMRMLAGFESVTSGSILLGGQDISDVPPNKRPVNMMFQSYALFPHLSVWDNIAFGLRRESRDKAFVEERVEEMLRLTRLSKFARRKPHQISGGQRQRVALARSLAKAPKLLLLDEPLGALDRKLREETQFELMDIQEKTGTTFVIVTHDQEEAMTVASRIAVMDEGRLVQVDTPDVIYEAPNSVYVADFIGDVNLIEGKARVRPEEPAPAPAPAPEAPAVAETPAPAPQPAEPATPVVTDARLPAPNARGEWLYQKVFARLLGHRETVPRQLPPPSPEELAAARKAPPPPPAPVVPAEPVIKPGGIFIDWAEGQPPIIAANGDPATDGKPVTLSIRPEKVTIDLDKPQRPNVLPGKVIDIAYLGNISTYHVELRSGLMIKAQMVNARRLSNRHITWEDEVWIGFTETAGVVLEE
ncbi:ABC transporter ATP-binding protein [Salipiger thiooxidans]|uniref:ABC transporter ATP-binding protein n=1 Tax=Salipiger thiooxidans TaxID=282683 RepID=UPI001CD2892B|nr:ABC transporter ATP-binding protein [Salipiger thiooxidans]MCA0846159.1 ABC transporter ATP-binding protein [Salipiger thiooxidans]